MANPYPAPANRIWAGLLRSVLALLTPVTTTLTTTPVVPNTTTISDENDQAAEPITPPCRARGPPGLTRSRSRGGGPEPNIHPTSRKDDNPTPVRWPRRVIAQTLCKTRPKRPQIPARPPRGTRLAPSSGREFR